MTTLLPLAENFDQDSETLASELRIYLQRHQGRVEEMIASGGEEAGLAASIRHAKSFDGLLCSLFHAVKGAMTRRKQWHPVSLAAVGSYGRGGLGYKSDLDVRLLCAGRVGRAQGIAEMLLYPLWDAGLSIGHQVVTISDMVDLAKRDLPTATTVLDWRVIAGDAEPTDRMLKKAFRGVFSEKNVARFIEQLAEHAVERGNRYGGSVYLLEPEVKNGYGGLRDLDIIHWVSRARWRVDPSALVGLDVLLAGEHRELSAAAEFLWKVRNLLHYYSKRRADRLSFDRQELLATDLGYGSGGGAVEEMMSEYYRHARTIFRLRETLLSRAEPPPRRAPRERTVDADLKLIGESLALSDPAELGRRPELALRLYWEAVARDVGVYRASSDAVARATTDPDFCERLRASSQAATQFRRLLRVVQRTKLRDESVLKELHDVGLLVAMIPEFRPVVGRVHHDIYHVYTVDVHSIAAVDRLRSLCRGELAHKAALASRLAAEVARPWVLFMAMLLHDIGKDIGGRNHPQRGADLAESICSRLGVAAHDIPEIQHLVLKHLRMYHVATRRDIDDPSTIDNFSREVHGHEGLRELYLLTVADVGTTSPTALSSWKARMLDDLYVGTSGRLQGVDKKRGEGRADEVRAEVKRLTSREIPEAFVERFLHAMPPRYLHANLPESIARHLGHAAAAQNEAFDLMIVDEDEPYVELAFVGDDRPGLLAVITAALAVARLKVVAAQIYSYVAKEGESRAFDLFWVRGTGSSRGMANTLKRAKADMGRVLSGEITAEELVRGRRDSSSGYSRPAPSVQTAVFVDNRSGSNHTVLEIITLDRPGLLFALSSALQQEGLTISLAKINTEGNQVADVFYVCDSSGAKITDADRVQEIKDRILNTLGQLEEADKT
ncbi:MAG TPA: [protein-PII] uridylyltransferase [Polyangiaceae bacterium]